MKKLRVLSLLLVALMAATIVTGCGGSADDTSSVASSTETTGEVSSEEEVEDLIGSASSEEVTSETASTATDSKATTTNTSSKKNTANTSKTNTGVPVVSENPDDAKATLPKFEIKGNSVSICIDWEPTVSWMEAAIEKFQEIYPGVTIKWKQASPDLKPSKLAVWKNSNQSPDAMYIKPEESWPTLINQNLVQPIDSYININDAFYGSARESMNSLKLNGKHYVLIYGTSTYGNVIYDPNVFKNAGLETPESLLYKDQWTWDKFEEYAKKLTSKNATDESKSKYGVHFRYSQAWHGTVGMDYIDYKDGKWVSNLNNSKMKEALEKYKELNTKYGGGGDDPTQTRQMLIGGRIGMYVTCEAAGTEFPEQFKKGTLVSVCMPRYTKSDVYWNSSVMNGYVIPAGAKNPEAGLAFATVQRGLSIGVVDYPEKEENEASEYTEHQEQLNEYCNNIISGTVMHFRRLEKSFNWWSITGPYVTGEKSYAAVVAEMEPQFMEELNKK